MSIQHVTRITTSILTLASIRFRISICFVTCNCGIDYIAAARHLPWIKRAVAGSQCSSYGVRTVR